MKRMRGAVKQFPDESDFNATRCNFGMLVDKARMSFLNSRQLHAAMLAYGEIVDVA